MLKKTVLVAALVAAINTFTTPVSAQTADQVQTQNQVQVQNQVPVQNSTPTSELSEPIGKDATVTDLLEAQYQKWLEFARQKTQDQCKRLNRDLLSSACIIDENIVTGDGIVSVSSDHPRWVEARQAAYMSAMQNAFSSYASQQTVTNQVDIISRMLVDDGKIEPPSKNIQVDSAGETTMARFEMLVDKVCALGEGYLDRKLKELGVPQDEWVGKPLEVKKRAFENSIRQKAEFSTSAATAGMVPLQRFIGQDSSGKYGVKVVFSTSPSRIRLLRLMLQKGADILPNPKFASTQPVAARFKRQPSEMFGLLGTRLVYDQKGYPVLVAFGQAGVSVPRNNPTFSARQQVAYTRAERSAMNAMTLLLNATTSVKSTSDGNSVESQDKSLVINANGDTRLEQNVQESAGEKFDNTITTSGRITNFSGIRKFHTWSYKDPVSNRYVVGCVLQWSPLTAQQAEQQKAALAAPLTQQDQNQAKETEQRAPQGQKKAPSAKSSVETENYVF